MALTPKRVSLLAQSVESLRVGIASGQWQDHLPPERVLCKELEISRSTLRRAIDKIQDEGLIDEGGSGKRRSIVSKPPIRKVREVYQGAKRIVWLTRKSLHEMGSINLRLITQLQERLANYDCLLQVVRVPEKAIVDPEHYMAQWLDEQSADVWILHHMPDTVQQWFSHHRPVSCIFGSRSPDIELASVEIDSSAAIRHAVASFTRLGHQCIGLVRVDQNLVGENRIEHVFLDRFQGEEIKPIILRCPVDHALIIPQFEQLFSREASQRPTALICTVPHLALFTLTWLQRHRISVPENVSMVLLRSQPLLEYASPRLDHYAINEGRAVTQIFPRLLDLLQSQTCETSHIGLIPEFVSGESIAKAVLV